MRRFVPGILVLCIAVPAKGWAAAASRPDCVRSCAAQIAACEGACVDFGGGRFGPGGSQIARTCRKAVIKTCRQQGVATCDVTETTTTTVPTSSSTTMTSLPGTTSTVTSTTSTVATTTTSSTAPPSGLSGLIGTWQFQFTIISTFTEIYHFDHVELVNGIQTLVGEDEFGGLVIANRTADLGGGIPYEFAMLDPGTILCDFYVFNRTSTTTISGQHYNSDVDFDGSCGTLIGGPDPLTGTRLSSTLAVLAQHAAIDESGRTALRVRERIALGETAAEDAVASLLGVMKGLLGQ